MESGSGFLQWTWHGSQGELTKTLTRHALKQYGRSALDQESKIKVIKETDY